MQITDSEFTFFGDEIEEIEAFDPQNNEVLEKYDRLNIYPANMFVTSPDVLQVPPVTG